MLDETFNMLTGAPVPYTQPPQGTFTANADISQGYLPFGVGWYRKRFALPASAKGQAVWLDFDGVMIRSQVYLNGKFLGNHSSGYTPFRFELDAGQLNWGEDNNNLLAVRADATSASDEWLVVR